MGAHRKTRKSKHALRGNGNRAFVEGGQPACDAEVMSLRSLVSAFVMDGEPARMTNSLQAVLEPWALSLLGGAVCFLGGRGFGEELPLGA